MDQRGKRTWVHRRSPFLVRALIFISLGALAQASAALPPGPNNPALYWASVAGFCAAAVVALGILLSSGPRWGALVPTLLYLGSVTLLLISGGTNPAVQSSAGGLSALVLLPVLAMALYYRPLYSLITIASSMAALTAVGVIVQSSNATNARRLFLWAAVSLVVAFSIHQLRERLERRVRDSTELARLGHLMNAATQSLTSLRDPSEVVAEGTRVMAELAGTGADSVSYLRVDEDPHPDDSCLAQVVESGRLAVRTTGRTTPGLVARPEDIGHRTDPVEVAFIPIVVDATVLGVVRIESEIAPFSAEVVARCRALGNVVELALANAVAHHDLEMQANTDPLTGLANRRSLALFLDGDRGQDALSMLVLDVDGLKEVNDAHGHDVGDRVLIAVAHAVASTLGEDDLLARTGGDEFVVVAVGAVGTDARRIAERIEAAVSRLEVHGVRASVSIGLATCGVHGDLDRLQQLADEAMYEAKRSNRGAVASGARANERHRKQLSVPNL